MNRKGELTTWSNLNGKLLYTIKQDPKYQSQRHSCQEALVDYEVFRSDADDITYTRNFYEFEKSSINLLRTSQKIDDVALIDKEYEKRINISFSDQDLRQKLAEYNNPIPGKKQSLADMIHDDATEIGEEVVDNARIEFDVFHFKVMEMSTIEDHYGFLEPNKCQQRFHFFHKMIRPKGESFQSSDAFKAVQDLGEK